METVLITGAAGYIGSHMTKFLKEKGYNIIALDNLSTGYQHALANDITFIQGDIGDSNLLEKLFSQHAIDLVMHFAGFISVSESVAHPEKYYDNNITKPLNLINTMLAHNVKKLIFSSSAAIYGHPIQTPITEEHPKDPINCYGRTKWIFEQILQDYDRAYHLKSISLRYFNASGAEPNGTLGENHQPETHLIPLALQAILKRTPFTIYGDKYDTADGTCVRDYIHVEDLCLAHYLAMNALSETTAYNVGTVRGYSVKEVIQAIQEVTQEKLAIQYGPNRPGDANILVADSTKIQNELGWKPKYSDIKTIIQHAWQWEKIKMKESARNA